MDRDIIEDFINELIRTLAMGIIVAALLGFVAGAATYAWFIDSPALTPAEKGETDG